MNGSQMSAGNLADLDELVLRSRSVEARQYIAEAVSCHRVGAYRSCIVATWNTVVYDYLHKLRTLDVSGDANAAKKLREFDRARSSGDVKSAQKFEQEWLTAARDEF